MTKREASRIIAQLHKDWKADGTRASFLQYCIARGYQERDIDRLIALSEEQ